MFVIAQVHQRIIGADFLHEFALLVNLKNNHLLDSTTLASVQTGVMAQGAPQLSFIDNRREFSDLWSVFPALTAPQVRQACRSYHAQHHIETHGPAVFVKARRLCPTRLIAAKAEFNTHLQLGLSGIRSAITRHHCTCCRRRLVSVVHAAITIHSTTPPSLNDTLSHTSMNLLDAGSGPCIFKDRSGESLSPDPHSEVGHSEEGQSHTFWPF